MDVIFDNRYMEHAHPPPHPERPERLAAVLKYVEEQKLDANFIAPESLSKEHISETHSPTYVDFIESYKGYMDPDTFIADNTYEVACLAAGGGITAMERLMKDGSEPIMVLARPPGHHAGEDYGCGFCYFNNIAISADHMARKGRKVAILDIDVHHGNGTSDIFQARNDVLYISTHQWGIFPGTGSLKACGSDEGEGSTVNIPFHGGAGDSSYLTAWLELIEPVLEQYKPDDLLVSIGGDAHYMDPLATLDLSSQGYLEMCRNIMKFAEVHCGNRLAFFLEGGYHLYALAEVVGGIIAYPKKLPLRYTQVSDDACQGRDVLDDVKKVQSEYWNL